MNTPNSDNSWQDCPEGQIGDLVGQLNRKERNQKIRRLATGASVGLFLLLGVGLLLSSSNRDQSNFGGIACKTVIESLAAYQDGSLDQNRQSQIDQHLKSCPHCKKYYEEAGVTKLGSRPSHRDVLLSRISQSYILPDLLFRVAL